MFVAIEHELNETVTAAALAETKSLDAFVAGCGAWLDFAVRSDYQRIAVVDAPAVLGAAEWHAIDAGIGLASMEAGLTALAADGILPRRPTRALAVLLFGALTDAGLALANGDGPLKARAAGRVRSRSSRPSPARIVSFEAGGDHFGDHLHSQWLALLVRKYRSCSHSTSAMSMRSSTKRG